MVRVVFLHPDLGIGGAERLVVDCALALESRGHSTTLLTAHHAPPHCFPETLPGGLCQVVARGDWLPASLLGRCKALCASIRMLYLTLYLLLWLPCDLVVLDQVSTPMLLLWLWGKPCLFYCHFPDLLLCTGRGLLKAVYRLPLDWLEEFTTGLADTIMVNSKFTMRVFRKTFTSIKKEVSVLYPSLPVAVFNQEGSQPSSVPDFDGITFLSINRYERKKNIGLAINALSQLSLGSLDKSRLIIAGGFDPRNPENIQHFTELKKFSRIKGVEDKVIFLKSPSDAEKVWLLKHSTVLVYTPSGEHFGIVPLEAMFCGVPVLARNSGGPEETVVPRRTGWLEEEEGFCRVMEAIHGLPTQELQQMGAQGRARVERLFSSQAFTDSLELQVLKTIEEKDHKKGRTANIAANLALAFHFGLAMAVLYWMIFQPLPNT